MAIATYDDWKTRFTSPRERLYGLKNNQGSAAIAIGRLYSTWMWGSNVGAAPTTAAVPARNIAGALGQQNGGGTALRIAGIKWSSLQIPATNIVNAGATWILCDRLSHQGGLSGTVTTPQTTNLPTAALTRYTSGVGVFACLEIYTQIGASGPFTVTATYTNQAGTGGKVTPTVQFGNTSYREAWRAIILPNFAGDNGFRSVESVTISSSTGTAGNFGVTLFKPLLYISTGHQEIISAEPVLGTLGGGYPEILDDACLYWMFYPVSATMGATGASQYEISLAED